jgi:uncharacterized membrane protein
MRTFAAVVVLASLTCALAGSAVVATNAQIPAFSGSLEVAGRHIPLPVGNWLLAGASHDAAGPEETRPYGAIETVVLFKLAGDTVDSFITIRANALPVEGSWGPAAECDRTDIHFTSVFFRSAHENFCGFVNHVVSDQSPTSSPAWIAALDLAARHGLRVPATWLMAGFRIANRHDVLDLRYHLNPELGGFPRDDGGWAASTWSPARIVDDAQRIAVTEGLARWVMHTSRSVQRIAAGKGEDGIVLVLPTIDAASEGKVEGAAAPESVLKKTLWKTVTYRVASSSLTFFVALPFTASVFDAGAFTFLSGVTHTALYFLHELAWDTFGIATPRPALEFAGAGSGA